MDNKNDLPSKDDIYKAIDDRGILNKPCSEIEKLSLIESGIDSLALMDLTFEIEKKFNCRVDFDQLNSSSTLLDVIKHLTKIPE
jgi:acyl carrier protein